MKDYENGLQQVLTTVELAMQFTAFRNVDLFSQGIYQLRVSASGSRSGRAAMPLADTTAHASMRAHLLPAHVLDATNEFCTPAFRVRYCEEEVCLVTRIACGIDDDDAARLNG